MSIDLLFIGFGVFVAEIKSPHQCRLIPWVTGPAPAYSDEHQFAYDTWDRVEHRLDPTVRGTQSVEVALAGVEGDDLSTDVYGIPGIGPQFPYGKHEGALYLEAGVVSKRELLRDAPRDLRPHEYHLITRVADDGTVRRYHGFHATKISEGQGDAIVQVGNRLLTFEPARDDLWYTGPLADAAALSLDPTSKSGAVYLDLATAYQQAMPLPKMPPGAWDPLP